MSASPPAHYMPPVLGNALWQTLHSFADSYPETADEAAQFMASQFIINFRDVLLKLAGSNCVCRGVFISLVKHFPPPITARQPFLEWTWAVHDLVNMKLGKPRHHPQLRHDMLTEAGWRRIFGTTLPVPSSLLLTAVPPQPLITRA